MDFKAFNYVIKVAEKKNFTKAAEELYISQPSLSQFISSLEIELNAKLFDRSITPLELTKAGEIYVNYGKMIIKQYNKMLSEINELENLNKGSIKIAASNFKCSYIMPTIISKFNKCYPDINIILFEQNKINGETLVENDEVDFALVTTPLKKPEIFNSQFICQENILLGLPPEHPYNKNYTNIEFENEEIPKVDLKIFKDDKFILLTKNQKMYKIAQELCKCAGFRPQVILQTPLLTTSYSLMKEGVGLAFIPSTLLKKINKEDRKFIYLIDNFFPKREIVLIYKKNLKLSVFKNIFIEFIKNMYKENI